MSVSAEIGVGPREAGRCVQWAGPADRVGAQSANTATTSVASFSGRALTHSLVCS